MSFTWTPTNIGHLKDMWSKNMTCAAIALALGCTRNAVAGKSQRLGLDGRPSPITHRPNGEKRTPRTAPRVRAPYQRRESEVARVKHVDPQLPLAVLPRPRALPVIAYTGASVRFNQLQAGQCKWITEATIPGRADEALACAAPIAGVGCPWCAGHAAVARARAATPSEASGFDLSAPRARVG